jgi:hypothetical protein
MVTPRTVLLVVAIILFVLGAAVPPPGTRIHLTPAGLAFLAASFLFQGP